ncbi:2-C-methyl-D-erythritol 2,4-cyclodiphosphate synthase [Egibacter rhizosphaerae]|uniref:2-C-methyl-D-erythritol 2,4-cyclodiphosphate synthase n=1 Tax=Egibacter rhizosphaerae TaxID=1670831 RepID=A0A411YDJ5_9ACTN|nr:2-C-methyl-D-erythritol 2,4-cyclodiphosphate synthase [Egibacter rhizosphaerae]QBI19258.1 2-C-methyl-D-erythritol 2,4-cyclodiphosphate synthase [Egibacter rhizosphaerae]
MTTPVRIGQGLDVHAFAAEDRPLVLGGVTVPGPGLAGHSDADVVLHAVCDAVLGAAALGDLGALVGVDEPGTAGASSAGFVAQAVARVRDAGWVVGNVDCTVVAQRPRLGPHRAAIRGGVAAALGLAEDAVGVSATTTDRLGAIGAGEGIACLAVALLHPGPAGER